ncbi:Uroporphyrinogen decarboxylase in heme biosynthesis [Entomophthora muscae]|uniref:Uroporphyrinogen decarboxylase in heme biosynthesis n=1 Tax=Entomophthora muscae TaxID=34485 RepID=A0ACC2TDN2_9FUNG|nr:Uroporphyrinogen decarboxylase in heme biosynthesis [Entomophthora muscae]
MLRDSDFPALKNDLILRTARGEITERVPVWIMRQAGRYLPEFREVRAKHDFNTVCRTPELACQVTLQPIDRYDGVLDAAIIFSDILVVCEAMGLPFEIKAGYGIHFEDHLTSPEDIEKKLLKDVDVDKSLKYVFDAITLTRKSLAGRVPLIGFSGAPWTLASYMIEGKSGTNHVQAKKWLFNHPEASHTLLQRIADVVITYMVGQVKAGAQMLQLFESWAGELAPEDFFKFSYPYILKIGQEVKRITKELGYDVPMILFAKGAHYALPKLGEQKIFEVISLDMTMDPIYAVQTVGKKGHTLQGNMDPCVLFADKEVIKEYTHSMLDKFSIKEQPLIANLGHGMMPDHTPENLLAYLQALKEESTRLRANM